MFENRSCFGGHSIIGSAGMKEADLLMIVPKICHSVTDDRSGGSGSKGLRLI